jgi:hypothetical protein
MNRATWPVCLNEVALDGWGVSVVSEKVRWFQQSAAVLHQRLVALQRAHSIDVDCCSVAGQHSNLRGAVGLRCMQHILVAGLREIQLRPSLVYGWCLEFLQH